jgi:hypothetical protein
VRQRETLGESVPPPPPPPPPPTEETVAKFEVVTLSETLEQGEGECEGVELTQPEALPDGPIDFESEVLLQLEGLLEAEEQVVGEMESVWEED